MTDCECYEGEVFEEDDDGEEKHIQKALAMNALLKKKLQQKQKLQRIREEQEQRKVKVQLRSVVAPSAILRRRNETKISRENRLIASRLEQVGDGLVRSSGYYKVNKPRGPLAKRNVLIAKSRANCPTLQQPEMNF